MTDRSEDESGEDELSSINAKLSGSKLFTPNHATSAINKSKSTLTSGSINPIVSKRRHSRLSFLPRVASEYTESANTNHGNNSNQSNSKSPYNIVIMGSSRVGKTAIIKRFLYDSFSEEHCPTVEELHKSEYEIKGIGLVSVEILDTSGTFSFPPMKRLAINRGDAFVLVYACNDKESFDEVSSLREMIILAKKEEIDGTVPIVVAGNKCDLDEASRVVDKEMVEFECIDWEVGFVECSARNSENVLQIFQQLLLQAHLKGLLKIIPGSNHNHHHHLFFSSPQSNSNSLSSTSEHSKDDKIRRRSSLPVSDLFHYPITLRHQRSPRKKRNSCAPS